MELSPAPACFRNRYIFFNVTLHVRFMCSEEMSDYFFFLFPPVTADPTRSYARDLNRMFIAPIA